MNEQNSFPCRSTWKTTVDCPVCGRCMQLKTLKYAHKATCPGSVESVVARAKEDALKSFTCEPRPVQALKHVNPSQSHVAQPDVPKDYSHLLSHLLNA